MADDEQARDEEAADDASPAAGDPTTDQNESTAGVLDEQKLREHASDVDDAIQEAKRHSG
jgi:hypothetical protein